MNMAHSSPSLHGIDLNLLAAFDALSEEVSVTKAAARAGVTQSAMSHTLRRLRELLDDPILVRGRGGMVLTPRAEALRVPIRAALGDLSRALAEPVEFDPATSSRGFRLLAPDLFSIIVLPVLLQRLGREAPEVDLTVTPVPGLLATSLETGEVDLAIVPVQLDDEPFDQRTEPTRELRRRILFRDRMRCFVRLGHPAISTRQRMTMRAFTHASHLVVSPSGSGPSAVDRALERDGKRRRIAVRVPQFGTALAITAQSDLVLTAPSALTATPIAGTQLVSLAPPIPLPEHAITMVWHPRFSEDPGHRWFRDTLAELAGSLQTSQGRPRR